MFPQPSQRLQRAHQALIGLAVGDALGGFFEFSSGRLSWRVHERVAPSGLWHWTDDTEMALSLVSVLRHSGTIEPDALVESFVAHYQRSRGYGRSLRALVQRVRAGMSWREVSMQLFGQQGSYGNGCASRVPPLGAFFADDLLRVAAEAEVSAHMTHAHPEAIAGTIAVAIATALAWQLREERVITPALFLDQVVEHVPNSEVRTRLLRARDLPPTCSASEAAAILGNGIDATVQTTVPFALWCAAQQARSYEDTIWLTLEGQGDCDTTCAIVGGIVVMRCGIHAIPPTWLAACEPLPQWPFKDER